MKLEINRNLVSEAATIETVKSLVRDLPPQSEVMLTLWKNDYEYIQAAGVPSNGFRLTYVNSATGRELVSTNQKLKQRTVMVTFDHFVADKPNWRSDVGWKPANEQAAAVERRIDWKRGWPVIAAFAFFALAFSPFSFVVRGIADNLIFKPMCAQANPNVSHFEHGSGDADVTGLSSSSYGPPTCWYTDNSRIELGTVIGSDDRARYYDTLLISAEAVLPALVIMAIVFVTLRIYFAVQKPRLSTDG